MKRLFVMKQAFSIFLLFIAALSCKKKDDQAIDQTKNVTVQMNGANEVPAVSSTGTGTAQISYDPVMKMISYQLTWQLGSASATTSNMHFHGAEDGSNLKSSPVAIGITGFSTTSSGTLNGMTRALTDTEEAQLLAGKWYVNIHSSTNPGGELRGNIKFP